LQGASTSPEILEQVRKIVSNSKKVLVILDSYHTHEHVLSELRSYSSFIECGQYLVCGDTIVEHIPTQLHRRREWGPGNNPATALQQFLSETNRFVVDHDIDHKLLFSCHPGGYLRAVK
jgi:cephalosporin hydroxylase